MTFNSQIITLRNINSQMITLHNYAVNKTFEISLSRFTLLKSDKQSFLAINHGVQLIYYCLKFIKEQIFVLLNYLKELIQLLCCDVKVYTYNRIIIGTAKCI